MNLTGVAPKAGVARSRKMPQMRTEGQRVDPVGRTSGAQGGRRAPPATLRASLMGLVLLLFCALGVAAAEEAADPYPLRPPDTSSPRDTLKSFLESADYVIKERRRGILNARGFRNILNATDTLDLSTTLGSEAVTVQVERVLLLKELLDRIELPAFGAIPGDREVEASGLTQWTIPNTRLTIARQKEGPRAGEFLFSARTVGRLEEFYRLAKDLPYKPGATTPGVYEEYTAAEEENVQDELRNRLKKIDASSPRSTLVGFLQSIGQAHALLAEAEAKLGADPSGMSMPEAQQVEATAENLLRRSIDLLDLSKIPEAYRGDAGLQAALQLKEVIDRTLLPFPVSIPDSAMVEAERRRVGGRSAAAGEGYRWRYPNTEIEIVEITEGPRRGQFLFSSETVRRAPDFYARVRALPYRGQESSNELGRYFWSDVTSGIYDLYVSSPGYALPQAHWLGRLVDRLPPGLKGVRGEQTLWKWIALLLGGMVAIAAIVLVFRLIRYLAQRLSSPLRSWLLTAPPVLAALIVLQALAFFDHGINLTGHVLRVVVLIGDLTMAVLAVWAVLRLSRAVAETLVSQSRIRAGGHDASLIHIGMRIAAFVAGSLVIIYSLRHLGADMVPLLAGLGVGGLAVALAAQRTFANFIGSLILFFNKPVRIGDFCRYGDQVGTIEHIGLLATRIRSLERSVVTVPNAEFSETKIDNFEMRDQRLLKTVLKLRYETTAEQIRYILARLRKLLLGHPKVTPAPARVRFIGYGDFSKDLEVFAYLDCADHDTFLAIQEDLLLRMEDIVNEAGSGFAFPSQTAYLTRDKGIDSKRQGEAEARVEDWRKRGRLPFPEFEEAERHRYENILDYPPHGSPQYVPRRRSAAERAADRDIMLSTNDLPDLPALALRLRGKFRLADDLRGRFSDETRKLLSEYDGGRDVGLKEALVRELNEIIRGPCIYDEARFSEVALSPETRELLAASPEGDDLARLNRMLLDDAFPKELSIKTESA